MAIREIITVPDKILRGKARKVTSFGAELQTLIDDIGSETGVSHAPLDLGGSAVQTPLAGAPKPATKPTPPVLQREKPTEKIASIDRIMGMKTIFTKLHAGAIAFLEEQIARWLKENPDIVIKRTNVVTGDVVGKKTEPNIIITVWY